MIEPPLNDSSDVVRVRLTVRGRVQGVGFRPYVFRLAQAHGLAGHVFNASDSVRIEVEGARKAIDAFAAALSAEAPGVAIIDDIHWQDLPPAWEADFTVLASEPTGTPSLHVPRDLATCPECIAELQAPDNRRFGYPLINCTACGPRFSILDALPYDRQRTSMRQFRLCPECQREYREPASRRFHAEPNACPHCGPQLRLRDGDGRWLAADGHALRAAVDTIDGGCIVAVKGVGGYHLVANAAADAGIAELRRRKRRPTKPLALMVPSLQSARAYCMLTPAEEALLVSPAAPIVLARRHGNEPISDLIAPGCNELGLILPYTPVHHLLMRDMTYPLAITSANQSGEPLVFDDRSAQRGLEPLADRLLVHNRPIRRPVEDSLMRVAAGNPQVLRLGRGIAPDVISLSADLVPGGPVILAFGGNVKTAPVLLHGRDAVLGAHSGDLESISSEDAFCRALEDLQTLHNCRAEAVACDRHPDYPTTQLAETFGLPLVRVQHHVAHIASVVAEHGITEPVLGIAWDGAGYGTDGTVWGGEGIWLTAQGWKRVARLRPFPLPGGEQAIREPRRALYGLLHEAGMQALLPAGLFDSAETQALVKLLDAGLNTPHSSSAGRLFDAAAALLGLVAVNRHEGEAAMRLEQRAALAGGVSVTGYYPFPLSQDAPAGLLELDWRPLLRGMCSDLAGGEAAEWVALKFHETMAAGILAVARHFDAAAVALCGGCFQNRLLLERALALLKQDGRRVYLNRRVPCGDGGLALGQALIARRSVAGVN